ncbi:hypothetical protein [Secundilactobacillus muriivasis]
MGISISSYDEAAYEADRTSKLLQAALRETEDASGAVASYNRHPTKENKDIVFYASLSDSEILHELCFQCLINITEIRDELRRLADSELVVHKEGA